MRLLLNAEMDSIGKRVRDRRQELGLSQVELAKACDVKQQTIQILETGNVRRPGYILELAKALKTTPDFLLSGKTPAAQPEPNATVGEKVTSRGDQYSKTIPVYGQAVAGVDGEFELNGNKLFDVMAPPNLGAGSGAYAVSVSGDSMYPRYEDGEIAFVTPKRRVKRGDYVVAQIKTGEDEPILAYLKKFLRHNSEELVLEQFNPPKEMRFDARYVVSVDFVAMSGTEL